LAKITNHHSENMQRRYEFLIPGLVVVACIGPSWASSASISSQEVRVTNYAQSLPNRSAEPEKPSCARSAFAIALRARYAIEKIEVKGSTIFGPDILDPIVRPLSGRSVTLKELTQTADRITQLHFSDGFINSRAIIPDQEMIAGIVQIQVIEGSLESIEVEGTRQVNPEYIRSRVRLRVKTPLNSADLE